MSFGRTTITPEQRREQTIARRQAPVQPSTVKPLGVWRYGGEVHPQATKPLPSAKPKRQGKVRATAAERTHMGKVKRLKCVLCTALGLTQSSPTDVHHIREGQGGAQRAPHRLTVALCHDGCHQGPHGIHGDRALLRQAKCTELDLLALTLEALETAS